MRNGRNCAPIDLRRLLVRLVLEGVGEHEEGADAGDADDDEKRHAVPHVPVVVEAPSAQCGIRVCSNRFAPPTAVLRRAACEKRALGGRWDEHVIDKRTKRKQMKR